MKSRWLILLASLLAISCTSGSPGTDSETDAGKDSGTDSGTDAGKDSGTDAGKDSGTDAGKDSGTDTGTDAGKDSGTDSGTGSGNGSGAGTCVPGDAGLDCTGNWCRPIPAVNESINRIWGVDGGDLWFVGNGGAIVRYAGSTAVQPWTREDAGTKVNLYAVWGSSSKDVWVGAQSTAAISPDNNIKLYHYVQGSNPVWTTILSPDNSKNFPVSSSDVNVLWGTEVPGVVQLAGCNGVLASYATAGGGSWSVPPGIRNLNIYSAWAANASDQWIVGRSGSPPNGVSGPQGIASATGRMFRNHNDAGWKEANATGLKLFSSDLEAAVNAGAWFSDIRGTSGSDVWAVGTKGLIAHFNGTQWSLFDAGIGTTNVYGVWPVSDKEVWFAGGVPATGTAPATPKLFRYLNNAGTVTWPDIPVPSNAGLLFRVWTSGSSCGVWVSGTNGILLYRP